MTCKWYMQYLCYEIKVSPCVKNICIIQTRTYRSLMRHTYCGITCQKLGHLSVREKCGQIAQYIASSCLSAQFILCPYKCKHNFVCNIFLNLMLASYVSVKWWDKAILEDCWEVYIYKVQEELAITAQSNVPDYLASSLLTEQWPSFLQDMLHCVRHYAI